MNKSEAVAVAASCDEKKRDEKDVRLTEKSSARFLTGGLLASAFAGCMTLVQTRPLSGEAQSAMYLLVASIPLLGMHLMVTAPGHEARSQVSGLMKIMPLLGLACLLFGLALMFETVARGAGVLLVVLSLLMGWVCVQSSDRASRSAASTPKPISRP